MGSEEGPRGPRGQEGHLSGSKEHLVGCKGVIRVPKGHLSRHLKVSHMGGT